MRTFPTAIGPIGLRWTAAGFVAVALPRQGFRAPASTEAPAGAEPAFVPRAVAAITALFDGAPHDLRDLPLDAAGVDPFRRDVYAATRAIAPGATATYGEIARAIGRPDAARAVGAALGANPWPVIVPCHRVLGADGRLTGFSAPGGVATKRRMLELEGAPGFAQVALFS
jgi:methylated-DNA-[protein]-cysteine S-methyltransferase